MESIRFPTQVEGLAPTLSQFYREMCFYNTPASLVAILGVMFAERGAMAARARASGTVVAGWASPYTIRLSGGRVALFRQLICHDPATGFSYGATIAATTNDTGGPIQRAWSG